MKRLGAAKGTGSGYRNLRAFPRDPHIHTMSGKGMKQPQQVAIFMERGGKAAKFGSVQWQNEKFAQINSKYEKGEKLTDDEITFLEIQAEHNIKYSKSGKDPQQPEETAVHELELYTENDGDLYRQMTSPIEKNLQKKLDKGIYDKEKAQKAFLNLVNVAARKYNKEFGSETDKTFTMADRREVAKRMEASFADEVRLGNRYD